MKEVKYRAWDTEKEKMAEVISINLSDGEVRMEDEECRVWSAPAPYVCRLMQYIGHKDKYGKEIYEGDIVKLFEYKVLDSIILPEEIVIINDIRVGCDTLIPSQYMEVIGNIYENPELLEN